MSDEKFCPLLMMGQYANTDISSEDFQIECLREKCAMWHPKVEPVRDEEGFPDPGGSVISTGYCGLAGKP